jgi:acetyl esterase/lipase
MISFHGLLIILSMPIVVVVAVLKAYFLGGKYRKFQSIGDAAKLSIATFALNLSVPDVRYLSFMSNKLLINKLLKFSHPRITESLPNYGKSYDSNSIWLVNPIDTKPTDPIIIYLHGGGYYFETSPQQLECLLAIYRLVDESKRSKLSILHLDYKLASFGYLMPHQLEQLYTTISHLHKEGRKNIILVGDSAGGNLAISYCQYIKSVGLTYYPKKLILISPWIKVQPTPDQFTPGNSYYDNDKLDIIEFKTFANPNTVNLIIGNRDLNSLTVSPGNKLPHDEADWTLVPCFNDPGYDIFVMAGEDEVFRDDILHWCEYALKVPLFSQFKYGDSNNTFDENKHQYIRNEKDLSHVRVFIEPWGLHNGTFFLENGVLKLIEKNENIKPDDINPDKYFGIPKVAQFLNDTL